MSLCTGLAVYNQVKKLTTGECTSAMGQKKSAVHRKVGVLQIVFRFVHRARKVQSIRTRFLCLNHL